MRAALKPADFTFRQNAGPALANPGQRFDTPVSSPEKSAIESVTCLPVRSQVRLSQRLMPRGGPPLEVTHAVSESSTQMLIVLSELRMIGLIPRQVRPM